MNKNIKATVVLACTAFVCFLLVLVGAFALPGAKTGIAQGQAAVESVVVPAAKGAAKQSTVVFAQMGDSISGKSASPDKKTGKSKAGKGKSKAKKSDKKAGKKSSKKAKD